MIKRHRRKIPSGMRRTSRIYLNSTNTAKAWVLMTFLNSYQNVVNYCIVRLWSHLDANDKSLPDHEFTKAVQERFETSARLAQCASKQAKEIAFSQINKGKKRMPRFTTHIANLDSRFVKVEEFNGHSDMCLKFGSGVPKLIIPFNWTKHTNKFRANNWELANSIRLGYTKKGLFVDLIFEKARPKQVEGGKVIGIDSGLNTMLVTSDNQFIGTGLKETVKRGGKRRKAWHHFIKTETNRYLKSLNLDNITLISIEDLKHVKRGKRGKFSRKVNRLLSFWLYAKVRERLTQLCEEKGIRISFKSPWKTSQRCSVCGNTDRRNRRGERFLCLSCGYEANADYNASKNLEALGLAGVYSLRSLRTSEVGGTSIL